MTAYRYVVFPPRRQPTAEEVAELDGYARLVENRFAWGTNRDDGGLTIAFAAELFEHAMERHAGFEGLIRRWLSRGCRLVEHLGFVKDAAALKPVRPPPGPLPSRGSTQRGVDPPAPPAEQPLSAKELAAKEAHGRSKLAVHETMERFAAVARFAGAVPYLLMAAAAAGLIIAGLYIASRLTDGAAPRKEAIERVLEDDRSAGGSPSTEGAVD